MNMNKFNASIQVDRSHYDVKSEIAFLNLFNQVNDISLIVQANQIASPKILIVGVGDDLLNILLREKFGYYVKTFDIDEQLRPNLVGSVDKMSSIVHEKFDIVVCAHVLEHLPYEYFEQSLKEIKSIANYAIIYLPIAQVGLRFDFGLHPIFLKNFNFLSTWFFKKHKFDGQHYWEIGTKGYPLSFIQKEVRKYFSIEKEYNAKNWLYSYNFVLKSRK